MRHFATESGKSKGQFYTPAEVSRVIAKIIGIRHAKTSAATTVYDPTCGSGSLLLKVGDEAGTHVTLYGQEKDAATGGLARMNMILHDYPTALHHAGQHAGRSQVQGRRHAQDLRLRRRQSAVLRQALEHRPRSADTTPTQRFQPSACRPASRATTPTCCTSSARSRAPAKARASCRTACCSAAMPRPTSASNLVRTGYIKGIIGLPANLFYGTGIPACIVVLDKENAARPQGHLHDRRLQGLHEGRPQEPPARAGHPQDRGHLHRAGSKSRATPAWCRSTEIATRRTTSTSTCRATSTAPSRRTCRTSTATCAAAFPKRDVDALDRYWKVIPGVRAALFETAGRPGYCAARSCRIAEVKPAIFGHAEFTAFNDTATKLFAKWQQGQHAAPQGLRQGRPPQGADRDHRRGPARHLPRSAAARCLRRLPAPDGLLGRDHAGRLLPHRRRRLAEAAQPRLIVEVKNKKAKALARFHDSARGSYSNPTSFRPRSSSPATSPTSRRPSRSSKPNCAAIEQQLEEMAEEHGGEEGLLAEVIEGDKGRRSPRPVTAPAQGNQRRPRRGRRTQGARTTTSRSSNRKPPARQAGRRRAGSA